MSINKTTHSPLALREGFHVVLLRALGERLQGRDWVLKGGTNLRLYFGSIRFSEDIDLDVGKDVAGAMQRAIPATLADGDVQRRLQALGILEASLIGGRSSKSTETTLRYKIELVGRGGIRPPTKIDVSYRDRCEGDEHAVSPANDSAVLCITGHGLKTMDAVIGHVGQPREIKPSLRDFEALLATEEAVAAR